MFSDFPREMAFPERKGPYRMVYNQQQFNEVVNKLNGKKNLYTTVYAFSRLKQNEYSQMIPDYSSAIIDKVFFDFDNEKALSNVKKLHYYLLEKSIMHTIIFSGGGFHLYIFCDTITLMFPYDTVENVQRHYAKEIQLTIGEASTHDLDEAIIGDLARVTRIPLTYNVKRKRWCLPITHKDLGEDFEYFKKLAENMPLSNCSIKTYGKIKLNLKEFDFQSSKKLNVIEEEIPLLGKMENLSEEGFYPCVENMIVKRSGCHPWYWGTIFLHEKGYTKQEADMIMKKYLSKFKRTDGFANDYEHYKKSDRHLDTVYNDKTGKHYFPSAAHLFKKGICPGRCPHYKKHNCLYFNGDKEEYEQPK